MVLLQAELKVREEVTMSMKKIASKLIAGVVAISMVLATPISALAYTNTGAVDTDDFIRGVDASTLDMLEDLGAVYYQNGVQGDALTILHNNGANYVRLKLWVDPYDANGNAYGGGNNDYATTLALAQRAKNLGMGILIDFHLSDFWADPANQIKPKAWENLTYSQLQTTVYNYMKTTLNNFASAGIVPDMVQVGNEISAGILYEDGQIVVNGTEDFSGLAGLLEYAIAGVRDSSAANTKIILHLDMGGQNSLYTWFFRGLLTESPNLDFDVFGLSYYPMWHGTMEGLQYNLNYLANTYNKEVCVVETAYAWTTEDGDGVGNVFIEGDEETGGYEASTDGQFEFMNDLETVLLNVPNDLGIGFFYWEPEWVPVQDGTYATSAGVAYKNDTVTPSNTWDNMTLFDFNGNALSSIKVLNQPTENLLSNISFEADNAVTSSPSSWNVWLDNSVPTGTVKTEYGNAYDGNYKVTFWDDDDCTCSIYKTFTNIPNGTYQFTIWAMSNGGQDTLQMYAKNYGGTEIDTAITTSDVNWNMFSIDEITVTNNTLEIGVYAVANANDWCNLDLAILRKVD